MCRMMANISKKDIKVNDWIKSLEVQAKYGINNEHKHGYGVAFYRDGKMHTKKEVNPVWQRKIDFTDDEGKTIILHARKASVGSVTVDNVHPFTATRGQESFAFCHNGTVRDIRKLKTVNVSEINDITDSEIYFNQFLENFEISNDFVKAVKETVQQITQKCSNITSINSFFSNGEKLIVVRYCMRQDYYYRLGYKTLKDGSGFVISTEEFPETGLEMGEWNWLKNKTINIFTPESVETVEM